MQFLTRRPDGESGWPPGAPAAECRLPFPDRRAAGRQLAVRLGHHAGRDDVLVLGLPRGGVPVASEIALALEAPLDVFVVRKVGVPGHEELALGAVASGGARVLNDSVVRAYGFRRREVDALADRSLQEVLRLERAYREGVESVPRAGRTVIVVDDGLATGATMRAVLAALRGERPARLVAAVPVAPVGVCLSLHGEADEVVCAATPEPFRAVGLWYRDFAPVAAEEVGQLLRRNRRRFVPAGSFRKRR